MIIVQLNGGLGNQLFQYAAARRLALEKNWELKLDITNYRLGSFRNYRLSHFAIQAEIAQQDELRRFVSSRIDLKLLRYLDRMVVPRRYRRIFYEKHGHGFDSEFLKAHDNQMLKGYFQNVSYFAPIEHELRSELNFILSEERRNNRIAEQIRSVNAISVHVRRGDYASNAKVRSVHGLLTLDYYNSATLFMANNVGNPQFFVFSDDIAWVRENLSLPWPTTYVESDIVDQDVIDLWLMSQCKHHIIANSTFSWWGAWLGTAAEKTVIGPRRWLADDPVETSTFSPSEWRFI